VACCLLAREGVGGGEESDADDIAEVVDPSLIIVSKEDVVG